MTTSRIMLANEAETLALAARLALLLQGGMVLHLTGALGAGKTTFCRGLIQALGHQGAVKSPTYTLVEPYELQSLSVYHFDLYRLHDPEELEFMGFRDYFNPNSLCIIEWPERGLGFLAEPDVHIKLIADGEQRQVCLSSGSAAGQQIIMTLLKHE